MIRIIKNLLSYMAFFILWHLFVLWLKIPAYLLPDPLSVLHALINNFSIILPNMFITLKESILGFLLANTLSVIIALIIAFKKELEDTIIPFAITLKTIPIVAITPLLVLWFGPGEYSKIATAALICFFPSLVNVLRGVKSLDRDHIAFFKAYSANKVQLIQLLIMPSILPYLFAALKVSSSLTIVGTLVGEFVGANKGLGFLILSNYYVLNTAMVFACLMVSSLMGIVFYYTINYFEKRIITWTSVID